MTPLDWFILFGGLLLTLAGILYITVYCRLLGRLEREPRPMPPGTPTQTPDNVQSPSDS